MAYRPQPFRGKKPERVREILRQKRFNLKFDISRKHHNYKQGFAHMLKNLNQPWVQMDVGNFYLWVLCREGWPKRKYMRREKRRNEALERILNTEMPF